MKNFFINFIAAATDGLGNLMSKVSSETIAIINSVLGGIVGVISVVAIVWLIVLIVKANKGGQEREEAIKSIKTLLISVLMVFVAMGVGFMFVNGVLGAAVEKSFQTSIVGISNGI